MKSYRLGWKNETNQNSKFYCFKTFTFTLKIRITLSSFCIQRFYLFNFRILLRWYDIENDFSSCVGKSPLWICFRIEFVLRGICWFDRIVTMSFFDIQNQWISLKMQFKRWRYIAECNWLRSSQTNRITTPRNP